MIGWNSSGISGHRISMRWPRKWPGANVSANNQKNKRSQHQLAGTTAAAQLHVLHFLQLAARQVLVMQLQREGAIELAPGPCLVHLPLDVVVVGVSEYQHVFDGTLAV